MPAPTWAKRHDELAERGQRAEDDRPTEQQQQRDDGHYGDGHNRNQALAAEEAQGRSQLDAMEAVVHGRGDQAGKNADEHIAIVHLGERVECVGGGFLQRSRVGVAEELAAESVVSNVIGVRKPTKPARAAAPCRSLAIPNARPTANRIPRLFSNQAAGGRQGTAHALYIFVYTFFHSNLPLRVRLRTVAVPSLVLDCRSGDESSRTYHRTVSVEAPCGVC